MAIDKIIDRAATITVSSTEVSDDANTSTGAFDLPAGTTAQRPGSPATGNIRHNSDNAVVEFYDGNNWIPTVPLTTISSISGNIFYQLATQIDINFVDTQLSSSGNTVTFKAGATTVATLTSQTISSGVISNISVPSSVYNAYSAGNNISISVTQSNGFTTNAITKTVLTPATGGNTVVTSSDGTFRYHLFTAGGTFNSQGATSIEYLVVGGGGGGGGSTSSSNVGNGGGGGAGGLLNGSLTLNANTAYTVTVGAGGGADPTGLEGSDSTLSGAGITTVTAIGGGGGGAYTGQAAGSGGSGGGGGYSGSGAAGTAGQGNAGGNADGAACGGGGGAGAAGSNGSGTQAGAGGIGRQFSHWATATSTGDGGYYAGGGGGGASNYSTTITPGAGGQGGGASGGPVNQTPTAATANTGGGGGGRSVASSQGSGGAGGSGIVIIRYALT